MVRIGFRENTNYLNKRAEEENRFLKKREVRKGNTSTQVRTKLE